MNTEPEFALPVSADESASPTITAADRLAASVDALIDEIESIIPALEMPHPARSGDARASRTVSREFIAAMIAGVEQQPDWRSLGYLDPEEAQAMLQFADAFRPVARRLIMVAAKINFTIASRKGKIAIGAMNTYMMAKRFARKPANAAMGPPLEQLRHALGRKNGRSPSGATSPHELGTA